MPKLFLIPCNLAENTQHSHLPIVVKDIVKNLKTFFVEEIKTSRRFVSSLRLGLVIEELNFEQLNKSTSIDQVRALFKKFPKQDIGIISEAGCPAIADPGSVAVQVAHELGYQVVPVPGPSSIFLALMGSGFNGQGFTFNGYLSIDRNKRVAELKTLELEAQKGVTQIFMETPFRNNQMFESILETCHPQTKICVACNLTAEDEYIKSMSVDQWRKQKEKKDLHKLPTIFVLK